MSWEDAQRFCVRLNALLPGLDAGLPSEAQWEYACRAGTSTPFSCGREITLEQANFGIQKERTVAVRTFPANPWGLYEMHGNVWEWCADWSGPYKAEPQRDPTGPASGSGRVLRGGSWISVARSVRSAFRIANVPGLRDRNIGFRLSPGRAGQAVPAEPAREKEAAEGAGLGRGTRSGLAPSAAGAGNDQQTGE